MSECSPKHEDPHHVAPFLVPGNTPPTYSERKVYCRHLCVKRQRRRDRPERESDDARSLGPSLFCVPPGRQHRGVFVSRIACILGTAENSVCEYGEQRVDDSWHTACVGVSDVDAARRFDSCGGQIHEHTAKNLSHTTVLHDGHGTFTGRPRPVRARGGRAAATFRIREGVGQE
jgi:hypothetical protein